MVYLRERNIPSHVVKVIPVTDPGDGDSVIASLTNKVPPRPAGSLPILAMPKDGGQKGSISSIDGWRRLGQSAGIMQYLDVMIHGTDIKPALKTIQEPYEAALSVTYENAAEMTLATWNTARLFGSKASPVKDPIPAAAKEGLNWVHRELVAIEAHLDPKSGLDLEAGGFRARLSEGGLPSHGDIMLLSFLELVDELYDRFDELTAGKEAGKDAYGRHVERKGWYPNIRELYVLWKKRPSAARVEGEEIPEPARINATNWADGIWD